MRITTYEATEVREAITRNRGLLIIHFGSPLASSCDLVRREFERLAPQFEGRVEFAEVELPLQELELIQAHKIETIPTLVLYRGATEVERLERLMLESEFQEFLELSCSFYGPGKTGGEKGSEDL